MELLLIHMGSSEDITDYIGINPRDSASISGSVLQVAAIYVLELENSTCGNSLNKVMIADGLRVI